ncbi:tRNA (adenosine(37)-N6)-threonylcarbamoyltransferase complex ATPase subunit type 1 TsaE [Curvivirga aplysinae]|uniref:tRNA (adenosine(37)-N6)-threonylcarbamoyltransferase complex ATPase subunit type 1 TsaE n=1 Tax=Curvivirga aplysinae TaxID=2529852 RepID=UPI0012BC6E1D|nr:tRNA (adenosine(37)-N6)-threonylcarbamoyltransferase complex ATPase subunit type 1 TsaE [Curvivirga aplysinae]MTI11120.1 tRNA (adenosine(37)-N6)-threonylcarbamoyltransferase complex ATPase subunit type 1 TsaE [Curvivirga aplysinae]
MNENLDDATRPLYSLTLEDEAATKHIAERLGNVLVAGDVVCLWGDLGAGKSTFARALIQSRQKQAGQAPSPTFTLVQTYETDREDIYHYDLYRLEDENEVLELGIDEAFSEGISLIEWPDRLGSYLPWDRLDILLNHAEQGGDVRQIEIHTTHARWADKLVGLTD